jgi:hypothetical protein
MGSKLMRTLWFAVLIAHATAAVLWWWRQPGGFAPSDPPFWVNRVLPWAVLIAALIARLGPARIRRAVQPAVFAALPMIWLAAAVTAKIVFPVSFHKLWLAPLMGGVVLAGLWFFAYRDTQWIRPVLIAGLPAMLVGLALPISQRAAPPDTRPINPPFLPFLHSSSNWPLRRI